jgi:hypothetical protein
VAIGEENRTLGLVSFEPLTNSLSLLTFSKNSHLLFSALNRTVGVIPDGYIKTRYHLFLNDAISSILKSLLFHQTSISQSTNFYDLLRFYLYANKISANSVLIQEIDPSSETTVFDKAVARLFSDSVLSQENISIEIVNATGQSGLGSRLERVISNLGGNVVSVKSALIIEPVSKIQFFGDVTYTLRKLGALIPYHQERLEKQSIAKIIIVIGKDNKNTTLF